MERFLRLLLAILLLLSLFVLVAITCCTRPSAATENYFLKEKDSYGREVTIQKEPKRIVSLSSAITEIVYLLHDESKLVGISDFCTYPPETEKIPKVGKLLNINVESILKLHPDLVVISSLVSKKDVEKMERAGLTVFAIKDENHVKDLCHTINVLGVLLNKKDAAARLSDSYMREIEKYEAEQHEKGPSVYYVVGFGDGGDYTAPGSSFINDIIHFAGGKNIAESLSTWNISREYLFEQNPDLIFIREEDCERFCRTAPYTQLKAVKEKRVYPINTGWIDVLSPRNLDAVHFIRSKILAYEEQAGNR